ncbi:hypothetical protein CW304_31850 [Bacillus sp. UFRGS-B20]|nr:hypothetical protein CW304_31850 [Bacillus sp. UFRGS-B20]
MNVHPFQRKFIMLIRETPSTSEINHIIFSFGILATLSLCIPLNQEQGNFFLTPRQTLPFGVNGSSSSNIQMPMVHIIR